VTYPRHPRRRAVLTFALKLLAGVAVAISLIVLVAVAAVLIVYLLSLLGP
jgi:hypothetical protein